MSKKKTTGFVAGAAGIALLMGGATFALWNDSADAGGATITAGNLAVDVLDPTWTDVSEDREVEREINLNNYRIVPGDTIEGRFPIHVDLEGNNLAAELSFGAGVTGELLHGLSDFQFSVLDAENQEVVPPGVDPNVIVDLTHGETDLTAVVEMTFDPNTPARDYAGKNLVLADAGVELKQVRSGDGFK